MMKMSESIYSLQVPRKDSFRKVQRGLSRSNERRWGES